MLRRRGHRKACGHRARLIRLLMQAGLEEAARNRQEHTARGRLIAVQPERRPAAATRRLVVRRLLLARTVSERVAWKRQEAEAREMLIVLLRRGHPPGAE